MKLCGREELIEDPEWATPEKRLPKLDQCFAIIEDWTVTKNKFEVMELLNEHNIPCGPVMDMKELLNDESLRARGTIVEVPRSEEHTSELQSLMRISYAVFCLKKKKTSIINNNTNRSI